MLIVVFQKKTSGIILWMMYYLNITNNVVGFGLTEMEEQNLPIGEYDVSSGP
jgi:hypothetical protein